MDKKEKCVYLVGRPPINDFLSFMLTQTVDAQDLDTGLLTQEWREANDRVKEIQGAESGFCDNHAITAIPENLQPLLEKVKQDEIMKKSFSYIPYEFGMVDLDKLIVFQKFINLGHIERIKEGISKDMTDEKIFELCMPFNHPVPNFNVQRISPNAFDFVSRSNDLRFLEARSFKKEEVINYNPQGVIAGIIGLVVGYGSNYLNALSVNNRLILNNGSHRAYALKDLGKKFVPCLIQRVSRVEELEFAGQQVQQFVINQAQNVRPPALKDYFDDKLRKIVFLSEKARHVRISFSTEGIDLPLS
ncbi:MAG: hypothetical protein ACHQNT_05625 [Bacteroidia bacterium]